MSLKFKLPKSRDPRLFDPGELAKLHGRAGAHGLSTEPRKEGRRPCVPCAGPSPAASGTADLARVLLAPWRACPRGPFGRPCDSVRVFVHLMFSSCSQVSIPCCKSPVLCWSLAGKAGAPAAPGDGTPCRCVPVPPLTLPSWVALGTVLTLLHPLRNVGSNCPTSLRAQAEKPHPGFSGQLYLLLTT